MRQAAGGAWAPPDAVGPGPDSPSAGTTSMADAEEEVEENRFRLSFLTGRPRDPTVTKASVSSTGSGTVRRSTASVSICGEL